MIDMPQLNSSLHHILEAEFRCWSIFDKFGDIFLNKFTGVSIIISAPQIFKQLIKGWRWLKCCGRRTRPLPQESFEESSRQVWGAGMMGQGRAWESEGCVTNSIRETAGWEHQADIAKSWPSCLTQLAALSLGQPCNSEGRSNLAVPVGFVFLHLLPQYFPASSTFRNKVQLCKRPLLTLVLFPAQP